MNWSDRLHKVIPGGAHTYSRGDDQYPANAPRILSHGKGAYVWDAEGRKLLDYGMGLRAVTLGYANEEVNAAAIAEMVPGGPADRDKRPMRLMKGDKIIGVGQGDDEIEFAFCQALEQVLAQIAGHLQRHARV